MPRITLDEWGVHLASVVSLRSTCARRSVGCVLTDSRGIILSTGYNGVAAGAKHCNEGHPCPGATAPRGTGLDGCFAVHAEQNALLNCHDTRKIHTCYVTCSPCMTCTKLLLNTTCSRIVFDELYPHSEAESLWTSSGRIWIQKKYIY